MKFIIEPITELPRYAATQRASAARLDSSQSGYENPLRDRLLVQAKVFLQEHRRDGGQVVAV